MIDSIKPWCDRVSARAAHEANIFIMQEANHSREHSAFNKGLKNAGYEIKTVEKDIINLVKLLNSKDELYQLRATIEHKAVAFNIWNEATKDWSSFRRWFSRTSFFLGMTYKFFRNRTVAQIHLLKQDGYSGWGAFYGMMRYGFSKKGLARRIIKPWLQFLKPNFHPWEIDDRHLIARGESHFMMDIVPVTKKLKTA